MALIVKDRVKQSAAAPGTGTVTLGSTPTGFQSFAAVGNTNTTYFAIVDPISGDWEVNYGVYTSSGTTLTRNATPLSSSNSGSLVNFTGAVDVFVTYPSEKAVYEDTAGVVTFTDNPIFSAGTANGVTYLNGSKVLTSGSALTFDGSKISVNGAAGSNLFQSNDTSGATTFIRMYADTAFGSVINIKTGDSLRFATSADNFSGFSELMRLTSTSLYTASGINVGIGTDNPLSRFNIKGVQGNWRVDADSVSSEIQLLVTNTVNTGFLDYRIKTNQTIFDTGGTERIRITSTGIFKKSSTNGGLQLMDGNTAGGVKIGAYTSNFLANGYLAFEGYSIEYGRFDASGNFLIGATTSGGILTLKNNPNAASENVILAIQANGAGTTTVGKLTYNQGDDTMRLFNTSAFAGAALIFSANNTDALRLTVSSLYTADTILTGLGTNSLAGEGRLVAEYGAVVPFSGTGYRLASFRSTAAANADQPGIALGFDTAGAGIIAARTNAAGQPIAFWTYSGSWGERVRITAPGEVLVGTLTNTNSSKLVVNGTISQTVGGTQYLVVDQSDIGTAPNEIPLNQYLGSLAYQNGDAYYNTGMTVGFRNRFFNGAMVIDQRNAGSSVTITDTSNYTYTLDRWAAYTYPTGSKFSVQQSTTAPIGFTNSLQVTSLSAYSIGASDIQIVKQSIEGFNTADLLYGTSNAKTITLSFWVYSSLTGTFGAALQNSASNRSCPFTYTILFANTWEYKTITLSGDTGGTWIGATNGLGLTLYFGLGVGSTYSGPANAWASADYRSATGATSLVGTNGATWYVTGVQIEKGNIATSFDVRPYGTELNLCQRYFQIIGGTSTEHFANGVMATDRINIIYGLKQTMRASPSFTATSFGSSFGNLTIYNGITTLTVTGSNENYMAPNNVSIGFTHGGATTAGSAGYVYFNSTSARVAFSAEL